ncbi:hypothetical protein BIFDEN_00184 [Bifidobacterium dentium ATCC 27678]|nr:hypothetical protein BIFDEN_00184 [Bifidobacterium dentium ATCC 27678]
MICAITSLSRRRKDTTFQAKEHAMRQLLMEISVAGACLSAFTGLYWLAVAFGIAAMAAGRIEGR